jgi:NAD(P)-dependent dehydrogenase (short-subunit alcohol dehydrogenase family)
MTGAGQRVAIITGGSQGIGAGLVAAYRRRAWAVVANSRRRERTGGADTPARRRTHRLGTLTDSGNAALEHYRRRLRAVLGGYLAEIADDQVEALATATQTLAQLVDVLWERPAR